MECDDDVVAEPIDNEYTVVTSLDGDSNEIVSTKFEGSFVMYQVQYDNNVMDIQHVYVPTEHRHQGVAEGLVHKALSLAKKNHWRIIPTCSYVRDTFFIKHPELCAEYCVAKAPILERVTSRC
jgi:predicted GNAT family acetyltransferase